MLSFCNLRSAAFLWIWEQPLGCNSQEPYICPDWAKNHKIIRPDGGQNPQYIIVDQRLSTMSTSAVQITILPAESIVNLFSVGSYDILKMSRLKQYTSIVTTRFRQAVYLNWTRQMLIPATIGHNQGYTLIDACFTEELMHDHNSQSTTVCCYIRSVNNFTPIRIRAGMKNSRPVGSPW